MKKKILVRGPFLSQSGYGVHARTILRALRGVEDYIELYVQNLNWGNTSFLWEDDEERRWLEKLHQKTHEHAARNKGQLQIDLSVQVTIPNEFDKIGIRNIGITAAVETTKSSAKWIDSCNNMDRIIVPSEHAKWVLENTEYSIHGHTLNLQCPVDVVPYPVLDYKEKELNFKTDTAFNFLSVSQWGPRKNQDNLIKWFVEEFHDDADVGLVLKTQLVKSCFIDFFHAEHKLKSMLNNWPDRKCKIYFLHGYLTHDEMHSLYNREDIHCIVTTTHGEGYGLPLFEAAYSGLPVIAPQWSGHVDFLTMPVKNKKGKVKNKFMAGNILYDMNYVQRECVWEDVILEDSMWCFPKEKSFKQTMRSVKDNYNSFKNKAKRLQTHIQENYQLEDINEKIRVSIFGEEYRDELGWVDNLMEIGVV